MGWQDAPIVDAKAAAPAGAAPAWASAPVVEEKRGILGRVADVFTGNDRQTAATEAAPDWATMPELNSFSMASAKTGLGTLLSNPQETVQVIQANFPGVQARQDERGNFFLRSSIDGQEYAIKPGFRVSDIPRAIGGAVGFTPVARAGTVLGGALAAGGTQAVIEGTQAATGGEFNPGDVALAAGAGAAVPVVAQGAKQIAQAVLPPVTQAVRGGAQTVQRAFGAAPEPRPTAGTMGSAGSAGTDMAAQRVASAEGLPVPITLTEGQASRDFGQMRFEKETAKNPTLGAPLRERATEQNRQLLQNFDALIDQTGAMTTTPAAAGDPVVAALAKSAARDKTEIRAAYEAARKAGDMADPVETTGIVQFLQDAAPAESLAPVLGAVRAEMARLANVEGVTGVNILSLNGMENLRKFVNRAAGMDPTNQKYAGDLKRLIDEATEGMGGDLYRKARALRTQYGAKYEDRAIVADLLANRKNMADPKVAVDRVFQRTILNGPPEDIKFLRGALQSGGEDGQQAWRELQGATLQHIREQATRNVTTNSRGDPVVSAAGLNSVIRDLDKNGRLDIIFGKQGAERIRDINEIAKVVMTAPPDAVNTSNTASVLMQAIADAGITGSMTGLPVPVLSLLRVASLRVKDRRIQQRVNQALRDAEKPKAAKKKRGGETIH